MKIRSRIAILATFAMLIATSLAATYAPVARAATARGDDTFLSAIQDAGIVAPDDQAVQVGRQVATLSDSGASNDTTARIIRDFGVHDYHVQQFTAAAIAAFG